MSNLWSDTTPGPPETGPLDGEQRTDVTVVGGGFTGLSAALHLARANARVVLLEAESIGYGGSGRNVGLVNAGLWLPPDEIVKRVGPAAGERINRLLGEAPELVFSLIEEYGIECEALRNGTLHLAHSPAGLKDLCQRLEQLNRLGAPVSLLDASTTARLVGSDRYFGALHDRRAGTIQPLAYAHGLAHAARQHGAQLFSQSRVRSLHRKQAAWELATDNGKVVADAVILATNAYSDGLWPGLAASFVPVEFFQFASDPLPMDESQAILPERHGTWDTRNVLRSIRRDKAGRLIIGSIGALRRSNRGILRNWAKGVCRDAFPQLATPNWQHAWAGKIAFTPDHIPRIHELGPEMISCAGYNGRGIGPGTITGKALAERLLNLPGAELPFPIAAPKRLRLNRARRAVYEYGADLVHLAQSLV